ncbi:MAG: hypothetical protein RL380_1415 [Verrucomicrobiota bacterium]
MKTRFNRLNQPASFNWSPEVLPERRTARGLALRGGLR